MIVADEVEEFVAPRADRRSDGGFARVADGPRRQADVTIGVVRRIEPQVALRDGYRGTIGEAAIKPRRIRHRGVAFE